MWKKFLNYIGLYTQNQYFALDIEYSKSRAKVTDLRKILVDLEEKRVAQVVMNSKIPFQFDTLLKMYNEPQLNSLYYKMINHVRNDQKTRHLLDRWQKRLNDAKATITSMDGCVNSNTHNDVYTKSKA